MQYYSNEQQPQRQVQIMRDMWKKIRKWIANLSRMRTANPCSLNKVFKASMGWLSYEQRKNVRC